MQSANLSGPLKGFCPYQALIGPTQASGFAGGFDSGGSAPDAEPGAHRVSEDFSLTADPYFCSAQARPGNRFCISETHSTSAMETTAFRITPSKSSDFPDTGSHGRRRPVMCSRPTANTNGSSPAISPGKNRGNAHSPGSPTRRR